MTGVMNSPSVVSRGSICTRSRIWMTMLDMKRATPTAKAISMIMYIGTHRVASLRGSPEDDEQAW